ncbi:MAG TPA: hypothetical protein VFU15_01865 [Bacteroidia bacterium]|nr:hypothetical protein [Bacteroidia bacterium]
MKTTAHLLFGMIVAAFLGGCKGPAYDKELGEVSALRTKLDAADSMLKGIDVEMTEKLAEETESNFSYIQVAIAKIGDTLDWKSALLLTNFQQVKEGFESVSSNVDRLKAAIDSTRSNLENLDHDLKNNSLSRTLTPQDCIEQETEHVNAISEAIDELKEKIEGRKKAYDTLSPKIQTYILQLNQRLNEKGQSPPPKK